MPYWVAGPTADSWVWAAFSAIDGSLGGKL